MAGKKGQKKRVWSDDEKRSICGRRGHRACPLRRLRVGIR